MEQAPLMIPDYFSRERVLAPVRNWTITIKRDLLSAVAIGTVTTEEALRTHGISREEWDSWVLRARLGGPLGLRVTKRPD
jgi:hypothetical protein